jgi:uncharacterized RDD family membrane protein YckC
VEDVPRDAVDRPTAIAYASFTARVRALVTDFLIVSAGLILIVVGGTALEGVPGSGRLQAILFWALVLLYEPLLVWRRGATIGHRRNHLHVVTATGERPDLLRSLIRFAIKGVLGVVSFLPMFFTRRHQALQDLVTGTRVLVREPDAAPVVFTAAERRADWLAGRPPRWRRAVISALYLLIVLVVWLVVLGSVSERCMTTGACRQGELVTLQLATWCWLAGSVAIAVAGWRGLLPGARRRAPVLDGASLTPSPE